MIVELSKDDLEKAITNYLELWFPAVEIKEIEFIRTKKVTDLKVKIKTNTKGE